MKTFFVELGGRRGSGAALSEMGAGGRRHSAASKLPDMVRRLSGVKLSDAFRKGSEKNLAEDSDKLGAPTDTATSLTPNDSSADLQGSTADFTHKMNLHFLKKLPPGVEVSNILVGEVDFLSYPIIAFIRLKQAVLLGDMTEVPVPTRFVFVLLGPTGNQKRYHEIGRSIATLMSDDIFHEVAYKARNRNDLLAGIDEFLDQVTVLPPGEWDPNIRIEPPSKVPSQEGRKLPPPAPTDPTLPNGTAAVVEEEEEHGDPTLRRTGRIFGGLVEDIKRKAPWYLSDFKDALSIQCIASYVFLFFACLTPIITFGGLLGDATQNNMAAMESILAGAVCGCIYHIGAGQPLTIIGSTGPVLVFETILFHFCHDNGLDYLAFRFWTGLWTSATLMIMVAFDLSALVRYITRFTEESFAALIALIFIYEAIAKLFKILEKDPVNLHPGRELNYNCFCLPPIVSNSTANGTMPTSTVVPSFTTGANWTTAAPVNYSVLNQEDCTSLGGILAGGGCDTPHYKADVFFLSCLLFIGTFIMATGLKDFKNGRYLPAKARAIVSDFSVLIAIVSMVATDALIGLPTPKLEVPAEFRPTSPDRGWFINPIKNPFWTIPAAIIPALLATILIFMDQQITAVIVNRRENKLKKGGGYHLDLFIIAALISLCSIMGLPYFVAATVLSINHVQSLRIESETAAPGETPQFLGVRENRVTGILVFLTIGISVLLTSVLKFIPMAVLYGVFLYMGVSSLKGVQLIQRISIVFMPTKYQPDYTFLRHVRTKRVHIFTLIQVICLAVLWVIKSVKKISIIFPLMVLAMCFVRKGLDYIFDQRELKWLDDIMPETHKREKEDAKKKKDEEVVQPDVIEMKGGGTISVPLKDGRHIHIPAEQITYNPQTATINLSDEMSKSAIWKQLVHNESNPNIKDMEVRQRPSSIDKRGNDKRKKQQKKPAQLSIQEEETQGLMDTPEIVVDPPSKGDTAENVDATKV